MLNENMTRELNVIALYWSTVVQWSYKVIIYKCDYTMECCCLKLNIVMVKKIIVMSQRSIMKDFGNL